MNPAPPPPPKPPWWYPIYRMMKWFNEGALFGTLVRWWKQTQEGYEDEQ